jgi:CheY-like chemotaxis protein
MVAARTVLYVEDNPTNVLLVERVLALRPAVELLVAMRGDEGFDLAVTHRPDLILLDLHLPDMSGELLLSQLQTNPATCTVPVVVVSADAMADNIARLRAAGAVGYLTKPFDLAELLAVVDAVPATTPRSSGTADDLADSTASLDPDRIADIRALGGEPGDLDELVRAYEQATAAGLDQLAVVLIAGDIPAVMALAHKLKVSSASLGATRLAALFGEIEAHAAPLDTEQISRLRHDITDEFRRAVTALHVAFSPS